MGYGTRVVLSLDDSRPAFRDVFLKKVENSCQTSNMGHFSIQDVDRIDNHTNTNNNAYCEFERTSSCYGEIEFELFNGTDTLGHFKFKIQETYWFLSKDTHKTYFTFSAIHEDYAIMVLKNGEPIGTFFSEDINGVGQYIDNCPPHWKSGNEYPKGTLEFKILYKGLAEYPVNKISLLCSHNAFSNPSSGYIYYQQEISIIKQLEEGIRALMLDVYESDNEIVLSHEKPGELLSDICMINPFSAKREKLSNCFAQIKKFLDKEENKNEFVFIFLEDYIKTYDMWQTIFKDYEKIIYNIEKKENDEKKEYLIKTYDKFKISSIQPNTTATLNDIHGKIVLFSSRNDSIIPYTYDYCMETIYGDDSLSEDPNISMASRNTLELSDAKSHAFLIVNNFPTLDKSLLVANFGLEVGVLVGGALLASSVVYPIVFPWAVGVTAICFATAIVAKITWAISVKKRNSGNKLIEKSKWALQAPSTDGELMSGHYGTLPNFIALDFVTRGNAVDAVGYCYSSMINEWISSNSDIYPNILPLGIFGLSGRDVEAYYYYNDGTTQDIEVSCDDIHLIVPKSDMDCTLKISYTSINEEVLSIELDEDCWKINFLCYFINSKLYINDCSHAFIVDNNNEIIQILDIIEIDTEKIIKVFLNKKIEKNVTYQIKVENEKNEANVCATFINVLDNITLLPYINQEANLTKIENDYKIRENHPLLDRLNNYVNYLIEKDSSNFQCLSYPSYEFGTKGYRDGSFGFKLMLNNKELPKSMYSFEIDFDLLNDDIEYTVYIETIVGEEPIEFLRFKIVSEGNSRIFSSFEYLICLYPY